MRKNCEETSRPVDRRATLFFPPAVLLTTLNFAAVLAMVDSSARSGAAGLRESKRRCVSPWFTVGLYTPDQPSSRRA